MGIYKVERIGDMIGIRQAELERLGSRVGDDVRVDQSTDAPQAIVDAGDEGAERYDDAFAHLDDLVARYDEALEALAKRASHDGSTGP